MKGFDAKKVFIALVVLNMLLVLVIIGVFVAASGTAQKKSQKIAEQKADLESNDQLIGDYKALEASLKSNKDLENLTKEALPSNKDQSEVFNDLDKFSRDTHVPLQQITFTPGTNKGTNSTLTSPSGVKGVSAISVNMHSLNTSYNNLLAFLKKIENSKRLMQVTALTISPDTANPDTLSSVDLTVDIYLKTGK
jgi:hypothetical protein